MAYDSSIHIVSARRTPIGRLNGSLKKFSAPELTGRVADATVPKGIRDFVDQVILGQVLQAGSGMNTARQVSLNHLSGSP